MSGTFEHIDVPPTLVSFAVTTENVKNIVSNEFKEAGHKVYLIKPDYDSNGLPVTDSLLKVFDIVRGLMESGIVVAGYTLTYGGAAEAVMKMCFGNSIGFEFDENVTLDDIFGYNYGSFIEAADDIDFGILLGVTTDSQNIKYKNESAELLSSLKFTKVSLNLFSPATYRVRARIFQHLTSRLQAILHRKSDAQSRTFLFLFSPEPTANLTRQKPLLPQDATLRFLLSEISLQTLFQTP